MKILFTGGGTGGHFYPIIAVAQALRRLIKQNRLLEAEFFYMSDGPYNSKALFDNGITFTHANAGKLRRYFSLLNFFDLFKTTLGVIKAIWEVFKIYPDVVFGKGGYASFPALIAARLLRIPVVIHESDSVPGRVNLWAAKFAKRVAVSYPEAARFFPEEKVAHTGNPIRQELLNVEPSGAFEFLKLEPGVPVILILGGSQGSKIINETIADILHDLVSKYQVLHQTGRGHVKIMEETAKVVLEKHPNKGRYKPFEYLNDLAMRMAAGAANLVISRAGSTIFEIAAWGVPSIIIPIPESISHDQTKNAFNYARSGACDVIEEINLSPHLLGSEIDRLFGNPEKMKKMSQNALAFSHTDAADKIALEILTIALEHER